MGAELSRSEIVLICASDGIDADALQHSFDECVGIGDEARSPVLRLVGKIVPELLDNRGLASRWF